MSSNKKKYRDLKSRVSKPDRDVAVAVMNRIRNGLEDTISRDDAIECAVWYHDEYKRPVRERLDRINKVAESINGKGVKI